MFTCPCNASPDCPVCAGTGTIAGRSMPAAPAAPVTDTKTANVATADAHLLAWAATQTWSNFAVDVAAKGERFGLSDRQRTALESMKVKCDANDARRAAPAEAADDDGIPGFDGVIEILDTIDASGNKWPRVTLRTKAGVKVSLSRRQTGPVARRGVAILKRDGERVGVVQRDGDLTMLVGARNLPRDDKADLWALLRDLRDDARATFAAFGKRTGTCGVCNHPLSNDESVAIGVGPDCRARLGW